MTLQVGRGGNDASTAELLHHVDMLKHVYFTAKGYWISADMGITPMGMGHIFKFLNNFIVDLL